FSLFPLRKGKNKNLTNTFSWKFRNNTQKPDDEFISRFQTTFADIVPRRASHASASHSTFAAGTGDPMVSDRYAAQYYASPGLEADMVNHGSRPMEHHDMKMEEHEIKFSNERTPRNLQDLNLTPSWIDPQSMTMMSLAGQHPGFYTPNSGGMGAIFHNQAGDLHTPTAGLNMITPLSLSNPIPIHQHNGQPTMNHFNQQYLAQNMPDMNPYIQQQTFAPSAFVHRDSFEAMDESVDSTSIHSLPIDQTSNISVSTEYSGALNVTYAEGENFRFKVSLRAPTAMVKHPREVPISYLNKGQAYNLTVMDSNPPMVGSEPLQYRTYVRVSFEEEEQRSKPAACWQLWKEGRGMSESHQRGGKLLAVEYVDPHQGGEDHKHRQIQVEQASFDGFCVIWTANPATGTPDCSIPVRFNFLSTDFSHSKGVKGIPVRLCAKTELVTPGDELASPREAEVCYCKVKLFRDHGAERKLSNDIAHVKKSIEKLKQQIAQAEMGGGFGKRKRGSNATANMKPSDRLKNPKHKRTWSMGSQDSQQEKLSLEDDLQAKLGMMQDMFSSTRTMSILALRGDEEDDPDLFPVRLPAEGESIKVEPLSRQNTGASHSMESLILSPTSSNVSVNSPQVHESKLAGTKDVKNPTTVRRVAKGDSISTGFIEAVDIDPTYRPPAERPPKPIACFYVRFAGTDQQPDYYRAIYLTERTVRDLMRKISEKNHLDPSRIVRILHVNQNGLRIMVDDDVVRELPEGQDMIVDIYESPTPSAASDDWSPGTPVEIKLTY
ncbi:Grainyhead-like protein 2, partial [Penicillium rolfsii]